jgi:hypothetical protein
MPQAWFNQAEAYFRLHQVTDRTFWFYYVQWALSPVQKKMARDILSLPTPPPDAYDQLKERLLRLYDQGTKDRCCRMFNMPAMGGRRPLELLADMLQLCPRRDTETEIFRYLFLFRLPKTIQTMLGEDESSSVAELCTQDPLTKKTTGKTTITTILPLDLWVHLKIDTGNHLVYWRWRLFFHIKGTSARDLHKTDDAP